MPLINTGGSSSRLFKENLTPEIATVRRLICCSNLWRILKIYKRISERKRGRNSALSTPVNKYSITNFKLKPFASKQCNVFLQTLIKPFTFLTTPVASILSHYHKVLVSSSQLRKLFRQQFIRFIQPNFAKTHSVCCATF